MKRIKLTQGQFALVDDVDYDSLSQYNWHVTKDRSGDFYAARKSFIKDGKQYTIPMARQILGLERGDKRKTDHRNHNTLDNQRSNIRICTNQQNGRNRKSNQNSSSQFKGVTWDKQHNKWRAQIKINGKTKNLGYWDTEALAALAYDKMAIKYYGGFAYLNFPKINHSEGTT